MHDINKLFFITKIYQRINIRIVMKALEIWTTGDRTERKKRGGDDLSAFNEYRNKYLVPKFEHDNAQLLRYDRFSLPIMNYFSPAHHPNRLG